ncbi:MAG TPA: ABC transporter permease [Usitatibacter sp.]|nr:ABC transporter permease [Usitatibacter sp.]
MRALDRKLARDLWSLKSQVVSIALVIACGIGGFIGSLSTYSSLVWSRDHYYDVARFPHLFASAIRVPVPMLERVRAVPGVSEAEARIVRDAQMRIPGESSPMVARMIGADFERPAAMGRLTLTAGRWPQPGGDREAVVNQRFYEARRLTLGSAVEVLLNGKQERLAIVGTVLSPEYIYPTRGTGMPDDEWFALLWMDAHVLATVYDMDGAFNALAVRLARGASAPAAIDAIDTLLAPYGGLGAYTRDDQMSHKILSQEISQQKVFGTVLPSIFLAVAAFILNVVLHRQVNSQRGEIAALKALGYPDRSIAAHYLAFGSVIVLLGIAIGVALGIWLGRGLTGLYTEAFHFPRFAYVLSPWLVVASGGAALAAAVAGTLAAIRGVVRLRAAEAMRPPAPAAFRPLLLERIGYAGVLTSAQRMVMRNLERRPVRAATTVAGIAASLAILVGGTFWADSLDWFMDLEFNKVIRADVNVGFVEAVPEAVLHDLRRLPGVREAEVSRSVAVRLRSANRAYRTALTGLAPGARLMRIVGEDMRSREPSEAGLVLTSRLAERLAVRPGDMVTVEMLEGERRTAAVRVAATVAEVAGMNAYLPIAQVNVLAREGPLVNGAQLLVDRPAEAQLLTRLQEMPAAAVVIVNRTLVETFRKVSARNVLFFTAVLTGFAAVIAVGVVYNNARIQLAERSWELASLRVLGFTRAEVSALLLGELAVEVAVAIPLGLLAGYGLAALLIWLMPHDTMELPLQIYHRTYLYAAAIVAGAGVASALIVRNRIDRLDLVAVLKTRE